MICRRSTNRLLYAATAFYTMMLLTLTHLPLDHVVTESMHEQARTLSMDKIAQTLLYTFLTLSLLLCFQPVCHDERTGDLIILPYRLLTVAIMLMLIGVSDEITQPWFGRNFELMDLAADAAAIFPGTCLFLLSHIVRQSVGHTTI